MRVQELINTLQKVDPNKQVIFTTLKIMIYKAVNMKVY
jgi:hypothetical protein